MSATTNQKEQEKQIVLCPTGQGTVLLDSEGKSIPSSSQKEYLLWLQQIGLSDLPLVGGKNASLGEMYVHLSNQGIRVPNGFVITTNTYQDFLDHNQLAVEIPNLLSQIPADNLVTLSRIGLEIRTQIQNGDFPSHLQEQIENYYYQLSGQYLDTQDQPQHRTDVAVRSSATLEDLPNASFAGQQETYLNVRGSSQVLQAVKNCFASLYTDRAISYRKSMGFDQITPLISVCIQKMVRSDLGSAGVAFTLDPESGFKDVVVINSAWGLGEMVVQGSVNPDELIYFKPAVRRGYPALIDRKLSVQTEKMVYGTNPDEKVKVVPVVNDQCSISEDQALLLTQWAIKIEDYYSQKLEKITPMDIEWAIDGLNNQLYIVQARPETVASQQVDSLELVRYQLQLPTPPPTPLITGIAVGTNVATGSVKVILDLDSRDGSPGGEDFQPGDVLVTEYTSPDWGPILEKASAIITNRGSRTSHAAIVARELGIPAVVGTGQATRLLQTGQSVTVSCCQGEVGHVYAGQLDYQRMTIPIQTIPTLKTKVKVNMGNPALAFQAGQLPNHAGVGLARLEFIISESVKWHPNCLLDYDEGFFASDSPNYQRITQLLQRTGYPTGADYYWRQLALGIAKIGAAFFPEPVLVRFSDFKSNEYACLQGNDFRTPPYEPIESNAMLGWRGASRYYHPEFENAFQLECQALKYVREQLGLDNVHPMIPFVRSVEELSQVIDSMAVGGLIRGDTDPQTTNSGLLTTPMQLALMIELPCNFLEIDRLAPLVDIFSIGSNDITQLTLGVDRDNERVANLYSEVHPAVKKMISLGLQQAHQADIPVGCCGQGPADNPDFAEFLVTEGVESVSVVPDSYLKTVLNLGQVEQNLKSSEVR